MLYLPQQSIIFFRFDREATIRPYDSLIDDICASEHLPFQLAADLEDIGQAFIRLADQVNGELARRSLLGQEVQPDLTTEAQIDAILARLGNDDPSMRADSIERAFPALKDEAVRRALKIALITQHGLPIASDASRGLA